MPFVKLLLANLIEEKASATVDPAGSSEAGGGGGSSEPRKRSYGKRKNAGAAVWL